MSAIEHRFKDAIVPAGSFGRSVVILQISNSTTGVEIVRYIANSRIYNTTVLENHLTPSCGFYQVMPAKGNSNYLFKIVFT